MTVPRRASTIFDAAPGYEPWDPAAAAAVDLWSAPVAPEAPAHDASPSGTRRAPGARRRPKAAKAVRTVKPPTAVKVPKVARVARVARTGHAAEVGDVGGIGGIEDVGVRRDVADVVTGESARERLTRRMPARQGRASRNAGVVGTAVLEPDVGDTSETGLAPPAARQVTVRTVLGQVLRSICTLFAFVLAVAAALMVAEANTANHLVTYAQQAADHLDLAVFDVDNGVMKFTGDRADLKNALFNRGVAALVWLFIGRTVERIVAGRPVVR